MKHYSAKQVLYLAPFVLSMAAFCTQAQDRAIIRNGAPAGAIVLDANASPSAKHGALELQDYLQKITGAKLPLVASSEPLPQFCIVVGSPPGAGAPPDASRAGAFGPEDFSLQTVGGRLFISGGRQRGIMYGCFALLEELGVRWLTPTVTIIPKRATIVLPVLSERQHPAFEYREPYFTEALDRQWAAHLRINGNSEPLGEAEGGKITYHPFVHSFDALIPRSLFAAHPEYFPLIHGKRTDGYVQRCLSNPDVIKIAIATVRQWMRDYPDAMIYSVSQNDTANWCECDKCRALTAKYGAHSGLYLWFVNQIAEAVEREHPDKLIDTLAYQFTEKPPQGIAPRENVRIRLCPISVCNAHPCDQCREKAAVDFMRNLSGWSHITDSLYIWHYDTDFANYLMPFPDFNEFPEEIRLFSKTGVKGIFFEGAYNGGPGAGSDAELRVYVLAKMLWNPFAKTDWVGEWMKGVYGPAAPPMKKWFDLLHANVAGPDRHMHIYDSVHAFYLDEKTLEAGDRFFDDAQRLATGNAVASQYVAKARLWLRYVELARSPAPHPGLGDFLEDLRRRDIQRVGEGRTVEQWAKEMGEH